MNLFLRFLSGASRKITLSAGIRCVGEGGKNETGVNPVGTNPAAIAWIAPDVCAVDPNTAPPPTTDEIDSRWVKCNEIEN